MLLSRDLDSTSLRNKCLTSVRPEDRASGSLDGGAEREQAPGGHWGGYAAHPFSDPREPLTLSLVLCPRVRWPC